MGLKTVCKIQCLIYFIFEKRQLGFMLATAAAVAVAAAATITAAAAVAAVAAAAPRCSGPPGRPASGR